MREPTIQDCYFVEQCYEDWPMDNKGPFTLQRAIDSCLRWVARDDEHCLIHEEPKGPVGLISWRVNWPVAFIDNIAVLPLQRRKGHALHMMKELQKILSSQGIVMAEFDALPGVMSNMIFRGRFEQVSTGIGPRTGLPVIKGRVMADTEI